MTEEEKDKYRRAKETATAELRSVDLTRYALGDIDPRLSEYVTEVAQHADRHNVWEQLAVLRFLRLVDRYGIDRQKVRRYYALYEFLKFPGKGGMQSYPLTPVQCFQYASIFGFWRDGRRVVKEACLFVPRKFSKTTSSASLVVNDLLYGEANAECYIGANSQDQARKCFNVVRGCIRALDTHGKRYVVNADAIKPTRRNPRSAFAQCLAANARTKDGLDASTVIMDEFSQARNADLLNVLTTSMGARHNPLTVIITTASDVFNGPFYHMLQGYKELLLGSYEDDSVFAHLFEPDVDDQPGDPATWRKVHPHLGVTVSEEFYAREWAKAQRNGSEAHLAYMTKLMNLYTEDQTKSWISATLAREITKPWKLEDLGRPTGTVAIDLSVRGDFSAVTTGAWLKDKKCFFYHTDYFFPEGALSGHVNERLYRQWASAGHLHLLPGEVIDYNYIAEYVLQQNELVRTVAIGYDPYKSQMLLNILNASGAKGVLKPVPQTLGHFTAATESFEVYARTDRLYINDNPINWYCFGNAVLASDHLDNVKPDKRSQNDRIDGVITMVMAHKLFAEAPRRPTV